jgi:uncharacterized protein (DUF1697 family)
MMVVMTTFVAFLRAINLGKVRRVPMADLRATLTEAGYSDVTTHLQSGNVVFASRARKPSAVADAVEALVQRDFGIDVDVMVRTGAELAKIADTNPLLRRRGGAANLYVAFLKSRPTAAATRALGGYDFGREEFALRGTELYLRYPDGVANSKMSTPLFERTLGTPGTVRTWKVVTRLVELSSG